MRDELKSKGALVRERERRIGELEQSGTFFVLYCLACVHHMVMSNCL